MLQFDSQFFAEEVRDGFCIQPMMKKAWAVEMEVLSQVSAVCKKYEIPYFAVYGSLLGSVRHKGFIPWDDDIDIALKRQDYIRLINLLPSELPEGYFVNSYYTCETHRQPWASVVNTEYILQNPEKIKQFWGFPYVCGIDIFPIDFIPRNTQEDDLYMNMYKIVFGVARCYEEYKASGELDQYIPQIQEMCGVRLRDDSTLRRQLLLLADKIAALYQENECDALTLITSRLDRNNRDFKFRKEWFDQTVEIPFETITISVPKDYEKVLTVFYGKDYMRPVQGGGSHEYPFYKYQQQFLDEHHIVLPEQ